MGPNHPSNVLYDIKFLFDAKCQIDSWRHQNGLNAVFMFQVKLISSERALEEE